MSSLRIGTLRMKAKCPVPGESDRTGCNEPISVHSSAAIMVSSRIWSLVNTGPGPVVSGIPRIKDDKTPD